MPQDPRRLPAAPGAVRLPGIKARSGEAEGWLFTHTTSFTKHDWPLPLPLSNGGLGNDWPWDIEVTVETKSHRLCRPGRACRRRSPARYFWVITSVPLKRLLASGVMVMIRCTMAGLRLWPPTCTG